MPISILHPIISRYGECRWILLFTALLCYCYAPAYSQSVNGNTVVQYYRIARTDAHYKVTGAYPFRPDIIKKESRFGYYKFTTENGRLNLIECYKGFSPQVDDKYFETAQIRYQHIPAKSTQPALEIHSFFDPNGEPMCKEDGVYAERLTLNRNGHCIRITNLDAGSQPMQDGMGIVHYVRTLDSEGRVISTMFEDSHSKHIYDNQGHYDIRSHYNESGYRITKKNYDPEGALLEDKYGIAITRWKYDNFGNIIQESYYNKDDKPTLRNGSGPHRIDFNYDDNGNLIKEEYFDANKNITTDEVHNVAEIMRKYDVNGNVLEIAYADTEGFLTKSRITGYAAERFVYNDRGDSTQRTTTDERGRPIRDPSIGAAIERAQYYPDGRVQSRSYYDESDQLIELPLYNAAVILYEYLKNGSIRISFLDRNSMRCEHELFGFSIMEQPGAAGGRLVFFDPQERRVSSLRVFLLNPYVHVVCSGPPLIYRNAVFGTFFLVIGFFIAALFSLRGAVQALRGKTFIPSRAERWLVAGGTFFLGIGYLLWLTTVQYVQKVISGEDPFTTTVYITVFLFLGLYVLIIARMLRSIRILNVDRANVAHWIRHFLREQGIPFTYREVAGRFVLTSGAEIRIVYLPFTRHAFVFYPRLNAPKNFDYKKLRRHLSMSAWEACSNGRCWFAGIAHIIACLFFFGSMQTASYFLMRLVRGLSGDFS